MDFMYFIYQYLPSYLNWLGYLTNAEPVKVPAWDIPEPTQEQFLDSVASTLCQALVGVTMPGMQAETLISTTLLAEDVEIDDPVEVIQMLRKYGALQPGSGPVGVGLELTKQSLKDWCKKTFTMQGDALKTALANATMITGGSAATSLAIKLSNEVFQRSKDLATLLANEDMTMDVDIDKSIDIEYNDIDSFNSSVGDALYQLGLVTKNTLIVPEDLHYPYTDKFNDFLASEHQSTYVAYVRNKVNHKILPYVLLLGDGIDRNGDHIQPSIDHFALTVTSGTMSGQLRVWFELQSYLSNVGTDPTNLEKLQYVRWLNIGGINHEGVGLTTPFDGYGTDSSFVNNSQGDITMSGVPYQNASIVDPWISLLYGLHGDGVGINPFFDDMTAEEITDSDNYELFIPVNNSHSEEHYVYSPTFDQSIKDKLILDEYDVATVNDDSASVDRDRERTFVLNPSSVDDLVSSIPAIADVLFPTVGVYPWDIPNQQTLTDVPLTIAQAGENIATKVKDEDLYVGTPDAKLVSATGAYGLFTIYKVSAGNLSALGAKLWSQDFIDNFHPFKNDPSEALISLIGYPMNISAASGSSDIICGNYNCSPASGNIVSDLFQDHSMGSIVLPEKFGNFMDYAPYTKVSMYLPFVGLVDLDADEVMGATLKVDYRVELLTGTAVAKVTVIKGAMNAVLYQYTCNVGFTLPLSASDFSRTYTSLMTGAGTLALGAMSGNPAMLTGGVASMAQSVASAKPDINKTGGMSGNSGMCGNMNAYVIIDTVVPDKPGGYDKLKGVPANQMRQLGQMTGFVKLNEFQLNNIVATDEEKAEIDNLLRSGVIV